MKNISDDVFKTKRKPTETKGDATTRAALEITEKERAAREKKTERLRLARLSRDEAEAAVTPTQAEKPPRKRNKTARK